MKVSEYTTARAGILQSAAYRNLQRFMTHNLHDKGVTMPEWGLLGLVHESGSEGISMSVAAESMSYELSHITNLANDLEVAGHIKRIVSKEDRRYKNLALTTTGKDFVEKTEKELRKKMAKWLKGISKIQLLGYINVLEELAQKTHDS